jgi:alanine-glyoxylate transaminase/serine-glyoxylate transaminase/serine-pyruvate transaminase
MFRIGHLGDINEPMLMGALAATEMTLALAGVPHQPGGVQAAMYYLVAAAKPAPAPAGGA